MDLDIAKVEQRTQAIGRELMTAVQRRRPWAFSAAGVEEHLMAVLMSDPALRVQMLRFVDVYPSLKSSRQIQNHIGQYFEAAEHEESSSSSPTPLIARLARWSGTLAGRGWFPARLSAWLSRFAVKHMARRFIVESDAIKSLRSLESRGCLFTLDVLGEAVHSSAEAAAFQQQYLDLVTKLPQTLGREVNESKCGPRVNLSVKLSALTSHFDPMCWKSAAEEIQQRLRPILRAAIQHHVFINIDMEHYAVRDMTWQILRDTLDEEEFRNFEEIGIVVQSYLCDAPAHQQAILDWLEDRGRRMTIRLVKGAYWDSEQIWSRQHGWPIPVLLDKAETDAQCERMVQQLLAHRHLVRTALGSHNIRTIARTLALADEMDVPEGCLEFQVLHGMGDVLSQVLTERGLPVRVYVPWGQLIPGMSYLVRRLLENTSNESFLRQMGQSNVPAESLLRDPLTVRIDKHNQERTAA